MRLFLIAALLPSIALAAPAPVAVAEFDYVDGSGEVADQRALHAGLLKQFADDLRGDLAKSGNYQVIPLDCSEDCGSDQANLGRLSVAARKAGARFLVFGQVHKQSTLIQWLKAEMIDLEHDQVVQDRYLTFRGDNEDAWRHAEAFLAKEFGSRTPAF
jgi:hypothetical protein